MKPVKLIISAFGPYADEMPVINFEPFEKKGLFLICGDTGAGKTTILMRSALHCMEKPVALSGIRKIFAVNTPVFLPKVSWIFPLPIREKSIAYTESPPMTDRNSGARA